MTLRGPILAGLAAALLSTTSAMAADLGGLRGGSIKDDHYMPPIHHGSAGTGLYFRGDFGWAHQGISGMYEPPNYELSRTRIDRTTTFGGGVGWYFSQNVRADFTLDHRRDADLRGSVTDPLATVQGERQFKVSNLVGLFNLYYDFDNRSHFTPYIGVGVGFARNKTSSGTIVTACPLACTAEFDGATEWHAAGAIMAGFSARLRDRLFLDAGYRFLYMGDSKTGDIRITSGGPGPTTAPDPKVFDQHAHEFRVGVRWNTR
jgi:opacity protein-like surface antigen